MSNPWPYNLGVIYEINRLGQGHTMQVTLENNGGSEFELHIEAVPADKAAQLQSDVTALVFGLGHTTKAQPFDNDVLENFLRSMVGQLTGKISAIKAVRCLAPTLGLKEAKDFVESVENRFGVVFNRIGTF